MIVTHAELAATLEHAEAQHLFQQVTALQQLSGNTAVRTQKIANGIAAFTLPEFGRKLNHVTGIAMGAAVRADALAQLEAGYAELGLPVEVDVCPHADAAILPLLAARGYHVNAFSNSYVLPLSEADTAATDYPDIEILSGPQLADEVFIEHCIAGFAVQATSRPVSLLRALAQIAVLRADTQLFAARIDGQIAGTAGLSLLPTPGGTVAYLSITSTVPAWRQRGVQTALLQARLTAARAAGCDLASVSVRPANVSARNAERAGFRLAYTKATFSRMGVAQNRS